MLVLDGSLVPTATGRPVTLEAEGVSCLATSLQMEFSLESFSRQSVVTASSGTAEFHAAAAVAEELLHSKCVLGILQLFQTASESGANDSPQPCHARESGRARRRLHVRWTGCQARRRRERRSTSGGIMMTRRNCGERKRRVLRVWQSRSTTPL